MEFDLPHFFPVASEDLIRLGVAILRSLNISQFIYQRFLANMPQILK